MLRSIKRYRWDWDSWQPNVYYGASDEELDKVFGDYGSDYQEERMRAYLKFEDDAEPNDPHA